jgi:AbiV family abortive infection protein
MAKEDWVKPVTPKRKLNMEASARAAYENGCQILDDANILFDADRFPRALALAILSDEEFSKAFFLKSCANSGRWDSRIFESLRKHSAKQGVAQAMRDYFEWFKTTNGWRINANGRALIKMPLTFMPSQNEREDINNRAKKTLSKPKRDYLKQDALYVSIDQEAKIVRKPSSIEREHALAAIDEARKFRAVVEASFGDTSAFERMVEG